MAFQWIIPGLSAEWKSPTAKENLPNCPEPTLCAAGAKRNNFGFENLYLLNIGQWEELLHIQMVQLLYITAIIAWHDRCILTYCQSFPVPAA